MLLSQMKGSFTGTLSANGRLLTDQATGAAGEYQSDGFPWRGYVRYPTAVHELEYFTWSIPYSSMPRLRRPPILSTETQGARHSYQASLLREVVGNPFRSVTFGPAGLTPAIEALADAIYGECAFDRMPVLGDALEDAGLNSIEVLGHCREPGEHVRGCWLLDALLGKA